MRWLALLLLIPSLAWGNAGEIGKIKGSGAIERGSNSLEAVNGLGIEIQDTAVTANATMRIDFIDETRVDITEHSRLLIDEFVYDPANDIGSLSIKATLGTVRYASGQIAKNFRQNVKIRTPSATIGVRGTDFIMVVDELGGSMITLLPSCDTQGMCFTGEIEVETDAGFVIMNQAFQTTMTTHSMAPPAPPLLLNLSEEQIGNILLLRKRDPYTEAEEEERIRKRKLADFLNIDFLEYDGLDFDALESSIENIWVTGLDETDYMLADMLYDILDQLNLAIMAAFMDELKSQNESLLKQDKTVYGFDPTTGIRIEDEDPWWIWSRRDFGYGNFIQLSLNKKHGYTLNIQQGEFELYDYKIGSDNSNSIHIIQTQ
jgi:hypothetical protein